MCWPTMYNRAVLAHWRELGVMPSLEERVAYLEGRFGEHLQTTAALRDDIAVLRSDMNRRFEQVDKRFEQVDRRFEQVDRRFDAVDSRFDRMDRRLDGMDSKIDRQFTWLVGLQMATLLSVVGVVLGAYFK